MKAGYKDFEILRWEYQCSERSKLVGFRVHSKEILTPEVSRIVSVEDLFLLSLNWTFELNESAINLPRLTYQIVVNYLFSTEKFINPEFPELIVNHSTEIAIEEFNKLKAETFFEHYNLKVHMSMENLSGYLFNCLIQTNY